MRLMRRGYVSQAPGSASPGAESKVSQDLRVDDQVQPPRVKAERVMCVKVNFHSFDFLSFCGEGEKDKLFNTGALL